MSLDVKQIYGGAGLVPGAVMETLEVNEAFSEKKATSPAMPPPQPQKITVSASVQCAFQIQ